ncbi:MAG: cyclase family protein [Alphaproteobacteria bacterium]|nr:cyclase family protein [Alphaproteobacteria bacterium]
MIFPYHIIDLTHTLSPDVPSWTGKCGFEHQIKLDYSDGGDPVTFRVQQIRMHAGVGTHIDAPAHCIPGGICIADLNLNNLIAPCVMIDVSDKSYASYLILRDDIDVFEAQYGEIAFGSCVFFYTGWERYWETPERYRNNLVFPSVSEDVAALLMERGIVGLGIDTISPDRPDSSFPVHATLLGAGKYIVENAANLTALPPVGAYSLALPIKTIDGTEAPIRLIGLIPHPHKVSL